MAYAMGYRILPLTGLRKFRFHYSHFCNGFLTQNTNGNLVILSGQENPESQAIQSGPRPVAGLPSAYCLLLSGVRR
jgi:hypothetical protein